jgi:hypothetical protein
MKVCNSKIHAAKLPVKEIKIFRKELDQTKGMRPTATFSDDSFRSCSSLKTPGLK